MNNTAYDTLLLKGRKMDKIESQVRQAIIRGEIRPSTDKLLDNGHGRFYFILDKVDVDPFNYPLIFDMEGRGRVIVTDLRTHLRGVLIDNDGDDVQIRKGTSAAQVGNIAVLNSIWLDNAVSLRTFSPLPMILYASWISESISRKLGLDPATQMYLATLFGWFYFARFNADKELVALQQQKFTIQFQRAMKYPEEIVSDVLRRVDTATFTDIYELIKFIQQDNMNVRLDKLQLKDVYALLNVGWFGGPNAREQVDVSVEFPPVFLAMVFEAVTNRSYSKSPLAQIYRRHMRNYPVADFERDFTILIRS